ncbi:MULTISPECIES: hypothetical protein [Bradyrhizobium]|uniref:hypothetical protein n=1 Tax=Bradyrhizobium TaxID=374 RepID=UPI000485EC2F|nr:MULTISPECIES: hypothetical protein [Bradyrhizobium]UFW45403.1 hypothetical protein BaraCB756_24050 [Bradyrhizobium arachidis]
MTAAEHIGIVSAAVLAASAFMVSRPQWFFGRKLSLEEALSVGWVAWSIFMAGFVVYIGLKLPLALTREADALAIGAGGCSSLVAVSLLARAVTDWGRIVKISIFALFILALVVVSLTLDLSRSQV